MIAMASAARPTRAGGAAWPLGPLETRAWQTPQGRNTPMTKKNALLVYPAFATSFWSFKFALQYLGKKSSMPPLGLLTLASMFPKDYNLRLVDMNVRPLTDADLHWADLVCASTMVVQRKSLEKVIARAKRAG